jgi:unsaturated rhamnogalacturonyl hydrolase
MLNKELWCIKMSNSLIKRRPLLKFNWSYDYGVIMKGLEYVWKITKDNKYYDFIKVNMDMFISPKGYISRYNPEEYNIDHINNGKILFILYRETKQDKYLKALHLLRQQLLHHPRTKEGGFWHKNIYPHQMWLDGIYMGSPFLAEYAAVIGENGLFDDVANQVIIMYKNAVDNKTGLIYHGYDESRGMKWSDNETGCSPNFWGRAMGWYVAAIVDILDFLPDNHNKRTEIINILKNTIDALIKVQEPKTGLWYQVLDQGNRNGNYLETSASSMFCYTIFKGYRKGYLDISVKKSGEKAFFSLIKKHIYKGNDGLYNLTNTCQVSGLGNNPYRDGSYEYYISEPLRENDRKGIGAFIQAAAEIECENELNII